MKASLIGKSGKLIATRPKVMNIKQQLLASGLISAILEFSKTIENEEIQSINYHDHSTSFIEISDIFVVVEISSACEPILKEKILSTIQSKAKELLSSRNEDNLSIGEGELILEEIVTSALKRTDLGLTQPFLNMEICEFTIQHMKDTYNIVSAKNCDECITELGGFIDRGLKLRNYQIPYNMVSMLIPCFEKKYIYYLLVNYQNEISNIGVMKVPEENSKTLFRLFPLLEQQIKLFLEDKVEVKLSEIISLLTKIYDTKLKEKTFDPEYFSLAFLDKNIKNIEKVIYPLAIGAPIILVGDKPSTKMFSNTLLIFTQHITTEVVEWLTGEDLIGLNITNMSKGMYEELLRNKAFDDNITVVNLIEKKVLGPYSSVYLNKIYDQVKKKSPVVVFAIIGNELENLVTFAMKINNLAIIDRNEAKIKLKVIRSSIKDESRFNKIWHLAIKRNPFLKDLLE